MNSTEPAHQSTQTLYRVFSLLIFFLVVYAAVFSWQSWHKEKIEQVHHLRNIMALEEKAIDTYLTQLKNSIHVLINDITATKVIAARISPEKSEDAISRYPSPIKKSPALIAAGTPYFKCTVGMP